MTEVEKKWEVPIISTYNVFQKAQQKKRSSSNVINVEVSSKKIQSEVFYSHTAQLNNPKRKCCTRTHFRSPARDELAVHWLEREAQPHRRNNQAKQAAKGID